MPPARSAWKYPKLTAPRGTLFHFVLCTRGSETPLSVSSFTVP